MRRAVGYAELVALADRHSPSRAWSIEATGSFGRGLTRFLAERGELVIEIERPVRSARRSGAKSDPIDAVRAGREALSPEHLARTPGGGPTGSDSGADDRSTLRGRGPHGHPTAAAALVITAPERLRARFASTSTKVVVAAAARLRIDARWDLETRHHAAVMRDVARRCLALQAEAKTHEDAIRDVIMELAAGPARTTRRRTHRRRRRALRLVASRTVPQRRRVRQPRRRRAARSSSGSPPGTGSADAAIGNSTERSTSSRCRACSTTPRPRPTPQRRRAEGKTDREIKRCLKRYIARQLFRQLETEPATT